MPSPRRLASEGSALRQSLCFTVAEPSWFEQKVLLRVGDVLGAPASAPPLSPTVQR